MLRSRLSSKLSPLGLIGILAVLLATPACAQILGLGSFTNECGGEIDAPNVCKGGGGMTSNTTGGNGGTTNEGGGGGTAGSGGTGGAPPCVQGATCYTPGDDSYKHGICKQGKAQCNDDGTLKTCTGEVVPKTETCANKTDENCDGSECVEWAALYGDAAAQQAEGVAVDSNGNVIVAGRFSGKLAIDPANPMSSGALNNAIFVAKLDKNGKPIFTKAFPASGPSPCEGTGGVDVSGVAVDVNDDIVISGTLGNLCSLGFGPTPLTTSGNSTGGFIASFQPDGTFHWNVEFEHASQDPGGITATAPAIDSIGNVYVAGNGFCELCGGTVGMYIDHYDLNGVALGAKVFSDATDAAGNYATPLAVAVDTHGHLLVSGSLTGSTKIGGSTALTALGKSDAFAARYLASNLTFNWAVRAGSAGATTSASAIASDGNVGAIVSGAFTASVTWAPATSLSGGGAFIAQLDGTGAGQSAQTIGGTDGTALSTLMSVDSMKRMLVSTARADGQVIFLKYDGNATELWRRTFTNGPQFSGLTLLSNGESWVAGIGSGSFSLGGPELDSAGATDALLARFAP